jgi:hypothetical protein
MAWICTELIALWVMLPVLLWTESLPVVYRIAVLVAAAGYALWIVRLERVRWDELGFPRSVGFLPSCREGAPWVAAAVLSFYASVSVTSQEFLYSSFFFWRYRPPFSPGFLVGLNSVVFAIAHIVYGSWVSVGLALAGRVILAKVYRRHGSFWGVWTLHLLLGVAAFLVGLGRYFYQAPD